MSPKPKTDLQRTGFPARLCLQRFCKDCDVDIAQRLCQICLMWDWWDAPAAAFVKHWTGVFWALLVLVLVVPATRASSSLQIIERVVWPSTQLDIQHKYDWKSSTNTTGNPAEIQVKIHWYPLHIQWILNQLCGNFVSGRGGDESESVQTIWWYSVQT